VCWWLELTDGVGGGGLVLALCRRCLILGTLSTIGGSREGVWSAPPPPDEHALAGACVYVCLYTSLTYPADCLVCCCVSLVSFCCGAGWVGAIEFARGFGCLLAVGTIVVGVRDPRRPALRTPQSPGTSSQCPSKHRHPAPAVAGFPARVEDCLTNGDAPTRCLHAPHVGTATSCPRWRCAALLVHGPGWWGLGRLPQMPPPPPPHPPNAFGGEGLMG
jgi:hypothetical protein